MSTVAIGTIAAAGIGAGASLGAAGIQAGAAKSAAQLQFEEQQQALAFQKQEWEQQQQNMAPWIRAGQGAVGTLGGLLGQGLQGQGPLAPWTGQFQAPTLAQAQQEPGYQFALGQGTKALTNSAAASGNLLTGNTGEALQQYGQQFGEQNYQNVYNRAMQQYELGYNQFETNQSNLFNRYASLAGLGQTSAAQLGNQGQAAAGNVANISLTGGAQIGQQWNNAAAAQASGYVGAGNAIGGAFGNLSQYAMLQQLLGQGGGGGTGGGGTGGGSCCWVATELYGSREAPETIAIFDWLNRTPYMRLFLNNYQLFGPVWAEAIKKNRYFRIETKKLFDGFLEKALAN